MPTISTCPHCARLVAIPNAVDATVLVRCPLCLAEYPLDRALELIPPELIPVENAEAIVLAAEQPRVKPDHRQADNISRGATRAGSVPIPLAIKAPPMDLRTVKPPPLPAASKPVAQPAAEPFFAADTQPTGTPAEPTGAREEAAEIAPSAPVPSFLLQHGEAPELQEDFHQDFAAGDTVQTADSPLDEEVFNIITKPVEAAAGVVNAEGPGIPPRSQRKPKSPWRIFVEIVLGGILGLCIGYFILAWIVWMMGARFDLPSPPRALKPVLQFVLPDRIWTDNQPAPKKSP
jgi:hypothetical protein